ncbi:MAG: hypothetical protein KGQ42_05545, partial [Alphaproteobacteria bacterium]|nr:hypothetical protein [Alphaproteobacteria bacterium]
LPPGVRGADTPGPPPKTAGQRAWAVLGKPQTRGCDMRVAYSALWATKLPNGLGIYPRGHVIEAAGSDTPTCHLRVVSYRSEADSGAISDFYTQAGRQAGYQVASDQDGLIAQRARDGAMFKVDLTSEDGGGTAVDMVSNAGK